MKERVLNMFDFSGNTKKELWFSCILAIWAIIFWVSAFWGFSVKTTDSIHLLLLLLAGLVWIVAVVLADMLLPENLLALNFAILAVLLIILFGLNLYNLLAVFLFIIAIYSAHKWAKRIRENTIKFNAFFLSKKFLGIFFTGLAIFLAFTYNNFVLEDYLENPKISPKVYHTIFIPVEAFVRLSVPGYQKGMTVEEFQSVFIENVLPSFLPKQFGRIDKSNISILDREIASQTLEELTLGWINDSMSSFINAGAYKGILPFLFIFALFSVFKLLLWPVGWLAAILSGVIMKVFLSYNIVVFKEVEIIKSVPKLE